MSFMVGDIVRHAFGFANPNHAAAAICALFPFCWGWRGAWRWVGWIVGVVLCAMLAMTYSRTGFVVLAIEAAALWSGRKILFLGMIGRAEQADKCRTSTRFTWLKGKQGRGGLATAVIVAAIAIWWMSPRMALDGAVMNRPKIWLAGLRLFAANPLGVGFGNSGEISSAFMLPDGITVRTLVNSHLTLLSEMGVWVGGAWLAFIALALCVGRAMRRTWAAFAGLAVSAFSASVFDWHVLFDFAGKGGYGAVNFALAWGLFVAFVVMGAGCVWGGLVLTQRRKGAECAEGFMRNAVGKAAFSVGCAVIGLCAAVAGLRSDATPKVEGKYVVCGSLETARPTVPSVYRDQGWSLRSVAKRFPDGARFCISPGVPDDAEDSGDVWLFGDVAEASHRFPKSSVAVVDPPEFYEPEKNVRVR